MQASPHNETVLDSPLPECCELGLPVTGRWLLNNYLLSGHYDLVCSVPRVAASYLGWRPLNTGGSGALSDSHWPVALAAVIGQSHWQAAAMEQECLRRPSCDHFGPLVGGYSGGKI